MRYPRGCIDVSSAQDFMLLQQVLRSRHVSHDQLWEFFRLRTHDNRRPIFNWRIRRLVEHEFVWRRTTGRQAWTYSISERGAEHLIGMGDAAALVALGLLKEADEDLLTHSLDLNEIHLALLRSGQLTGWKSELEIRSQNELTGYGYAKDYDAVVTINDDGDKLQFALEYERQPKAAKRYPRIREAVENEAQVPCLLYLFPSYSLLTYVAGFYERCPRPVYFGLLAEFRRDGLNAQVLDWRRTSKQNFRDALCEMQNAEMQ